MQKQVKTPEKSVIIIGAGPIGCYCGELLSKKGYSVKIFEEDRVSGKPVQCSGIVTKSIQEIKGIQLNKQTIVNKPHFVNVYAPNGKKIRVGSQDIVLDRSKFDQERALNAEKNGVNINYGRRICFYDIKYVNKDRKKQFWKIRTKEQTHTSKFLIGADGPNSIVSRYIGNKPCAGWLGIQAVCKINCDKYTYKTYFGGELKDFFGWVIPENENIARIAIATKLPNTDKSKTNIKTTPRDVFSRFIKHFDCKIMKMQAGVIPKYNPKQIIEKNNAFILGDAATQVKATTGGGLVPGLKAAEGLVKAIDEKTPYKTNIKNIRKELYTSTVIRKTLDKFTDNDYNKLISILRDQKLQQILKTTDRDNPTELLIQIILKKPQLLSFIPIVLR